MKIVIVNTADTGGGAERAASTLADGLRARGHSVSFLCGYAHRNNSRAIMGKFDWVLGRVIKRIGYADAFSFGAYRFLNYPEVRNADIIHFHNLHGFYFGIGMLPKIIAAKPCVWTLHDCWGISGGCYSLLGCSKWVENCNNCPGHGIHPMTGILDSASKMLELKRMAFAKMVKHGGIMTGVSSWMTSNIRKAFSAAKLDTSKVYCVQNFVDVVSDQENSQVISEAISANSAVILLVSANLNAPTKGILTALVALQALLPQSFTLLTVGISLTESVLKEFGLLGRAIQLGPLNSRSVLSAVYRRATVTIVPSLAESFSLVAAESIACGTPVVASNAAALPELVQDGKTGFLAEVNNPKSFKQRLEKILNMPFGEYQELRITTQKYAKENFISFTSWIDNYVSLYKRAISEHRSE